MMTQSAGLDLSDFPKDHSAQYSDICGSPKAKAVREFRFVSSVGFW